LLKGHEFGKLKKDLNKLTFSTDEIKAIEFLIGLRKLSVDTAILFKKVFKNAGVSSDQLRNFGGRIGVSSKLLDAFEEFEFTVDGDVTMCLFGLKPGKELGELIKEIETNNFKKLLGVS